MAYCKSTIASPAGTTTSTGSTSLPATGSFSLTGSVFYTAPPTLATGEYLYQTDGIYVVSTNTITWQTPYLSNLKVGSLQAISANMGVVSIANPGSIATYGRSYGSTTVAGFFLGYDSTTYKFDLGNATGTTYFKYDGTNVSMKGGVILGGAYTGLSFAWPPAGAGGGFYLAPDGLTLGSLNDGTYFAVLANGDIYAPQFTVIGGAASFGGTLTVGTTPAISGTTMSGNGAVINSTGSFAIGNSTTNISFAGGAGTMYLNGDLVATGNINTNAVTVPLAVYTAGVVNKTTTTTYDTLEIQSITISAITGIKNFISFNAFGYSNRKEEFYMFVQRMSDNQVMWQVGSGAGGVTTEIGTNTTIAGSFIDSPSTGSVTYKMYLGHGLSGFSLYANSRSMVAITIKR